MQPRRRHTICGKAATEEFAHDDIAAVVKQIVIEQLGIKESDYAEDKEFVCDLGMD